MEDMVALELWCLISIFHIVVMWMYAFKIKNKHHLTYFQHPPNLSKQDSSKNPFSTSFTGFRGFTTRVISRSSQNTCKSE